ncbi:hypothetical protein NKJ16_08650 [Mesorhizobium sp. M0179]|uniref:hypothetical protein n=1 Tax=Mesorhizobium sp. M0179 TaxID=2956905 RepID=UPI00333CC1D1
MPRDGSGIYSYPPNGDGIPNTPISSAAYNTRSADVLTDMNAVRPVPAGGTGANTAVGGADKLNGIGTNVASSATLDLAGSTGTLVTVTGTTTITAINALPAGAERDLIFAGALILTHGAALVLPGAANITTAAGDTARMRSLGGGNWKCMNFERQNGQLVGPLSQPALTLEQSAAPVPTAEGRIMWDTDDDAIVVGDGAATRIFVPLPASTAAGDVLYLSAAKILTRIAKGTALQAFLMNAGATAPNWATLPFSKSFESSQQTFAAGGLVTVAHGLGVSPKLYMVVVVNQIAERGYVPGDEVQVNPAIGETASQDKGYGIYVDATNVNVRIGSGGGGILANKTTGTFAGGSFAAANWKLVVRAWA